MVFVLLCKGTRQRQTHIVVIDVPNTYEHSIGWFLGHGMKVDIAGCIQGVYT